MLEAALGLPVVPMTASRAVGVRELLEVVEDVLARQADPWRRARPRCAPITAKCWKKSRG